MLYKHLSPFLKHVAPCVIALKCHAMPLMACTGVATQLTLSSMASQESGSLLALPCAVFLGTFMILAVRFYSLKPWAGILLLPLLGFSVFGAALLNLSLRSGNAEVSAASLSASALHDELDDIASECTPCFPALAAYQETGRYEVLQACHCNPG